jgi:hypothetical protein
MSRQPARRRGSSERGVVNFPVAWSLKEDPEEVAKVTTVAGAATHRLTFGAPVSLAGLLYFNTNLGGLTVTLTNNAGMTAQTFAVPDTEDGLQQNVLFNLEGVANASATQWNLVITGAGAVVGIGRVITVTAAAGWLKPRVRWQYEIEEVFPDIEHRNSHKKRFVEEIPVRVRMFSCEADWAEDRNMLRSHRRATHGAARSFPLVPDEDDAADVFLVQYTSGAKKEQYNFHDGSFSAGTVDGEVSQRIEAEEVNAGLALD